MDGRAFNTTASITDLRTDIKIEYKFLPINPWLPKMFPGELQDAVEPLPEGEGATWEGILKRRVKNWNMKISKFAIT